MYKYTKGATNNKLSNLSNIPPCPGIILPLSLVLTCLLNFDSTRSPVVPNMEAINEIIIKLVRDNKSQKYESKIAVINENRTPPIKPSTVFFGDTLSNNFNLPKFFPIKKAKLSLTHIRIIKVKIIDFSYTPFIKGRSIKKVKESSK